MNSTTTLKAPFVPLEHSRERSQYPLSILPGWKSQTIRPVNAWANRLLRSLPDTCIEKIERSLLSVHLAREKCLSRQGAIPEYIYFPETAVISHQVMLADGRTVEIALTGREGALGMQSLFGSGTCASSTQIAQEGVAVRIEREILIKTIRIYPELVRPLAFGLGRYIDDVSRRSMCNMYHDVRPRLATWLLLMGDLCGKDELVLTHEQIAGSLGVYRPTVTTTTSKMRELGLIEYSRAVITIPDRLRLRQVACSCYAELAGR